MKVSIGEAVILAAEISLLLERICHKVEIVGTIRQGRATVEEIELVAVPKDLKEFGKEIDKVFTQVLEHDQHELVARYEGMKVIVTKTESMAWNFAIKEAV
jgi:DNA polymerase/3'-5' exonuclease PolX